MTTVGIAGDPNLDAVQSAFAALGDLSSEVVLVGGCATGLLVTSVRSEMIRPTLDVDLVLEVVTRKDYRRMEQAFRARGSSDFLSSHDLEDIMTVVDGREELEQEIAAAPEDIQGAIRKQFDELISDARLVEAMAGFLPGDAASQARLPDLLARLNRLAK